MEVDDTPLQVKLDQLAGYIARLGGSIALLLLVILLIKYLVAEGADGVWPSPALVAEAIIRV